MFGAGLPVAALAYPASPRTPTDPSPYPCGPPLSPLSRAPPPQVLRELLTPGVNGVEFSTAAELAAHMQARGPRRAAP